MVAKNRRQWLNLLGAATLFSLVAIIYAPSLKGEFIWDDLLNIFKNPLIRQDGGLLQLWIPGRNYDYYPVTFTSWWLDWRAWGRSTVGYHAENVLLHAASAMLLWQVLLRLKVRGAWAAAAIVAVHPLNVESVAWISERKNTLSLVFYLLSLLLLLESEGQNGRRRLFVSSIFCFALGLLAKPSGVFLPLVFLGLSWWKRGAIQRREAFCAIPYFILSAGLGATTIWIHHSRGIAGDLVRTDGIAARAAGAGRAVWFYASKVIWPSKLIFIYPRWTISGRNILDYVPLTGLLVLATSFWFLRTRIGRTPFQVLTAFVLLLAPVLGLVDVYFFRFSFVSDHWAYLASIVLIAGIAAGANSLIDKLGASARRPVAVVAAGAVLIALGVASFRQAHLYQNEETLWRDTIAKNPSAFVAWNNLAAALIGRAHYEEAADALRESIRQNPGDALAYVGFGDIDQRQGRLTEAIGWYRKAVSIEPENATARLMLANALVDAKELSQAADEFETLRRVDPRSTGVDLQLAKLYRRLANLPAAAEACRRAVAEDPHDPEPQEWLGVIEIEAGDVGAGQASLETADRLDQRSFTNALNRGSFLLSIGHPSEAIHQFDLASARDPASARPAVKRGIALESMGRLNDAAAQFKEASRLQPGLAEASAGLQRVESKLRSPSR